ncbi:MAG TPA: septal ring lytic transglycosylase RlpA family protein [Thermodesulfovibrionia bacterium]|nr:septal ring lytic transglycosylase RlpA family protein [Thermodesulfovibrionia bacterium]
MSEKFCIVFLFVFVSNCASHKPQTIEKLPPVYEPGSFELRELESSNVVASWYGKPFHGRMTASGEKFDMYAMTCAHKTLPFGTKLKVSNPDSGRTVEVVVNDRGPFIDGRDLDLSYGAAKEIGLVGQGVAEVRLSYLGRDESYRKKVRYSPFSSLGPFTIQMGSFKVNENAMRIMKVLKAKYPDVYIRSAYVNDEKFYRVRLGRFSIRKEAARLAEILAYEGYDVMVTASEDN